MSSPTIPDAGANPPGSTGSIDSFYDPELDQMLKGTSANAPAFGEACEALGIPIEVADEGNDAEVDSENKTNIQRSFLPWQIRAIAWTIGQESCPIRGGMLAHPQKFGKTSTVLAEILCAAYKATQSPAPVFRPNLVVTSNERLDNWVDVITGDFRGHFDLLDLHRTYNSQKIRIKDMNQLHEWAETLDTTSIKTALTVVVTTYGTWSGQATKELTRGGLKGSQGLSLSLSAFGVTLVDFCVNAKSEG